jgi:hypothetical protein
MWLNENVTLENVTIVGQLAFIYGECFLVKNSRSKKCFLLIGGIFIFIKIIIMLSKKDLIKCAIMVNYSFEEKMLLFSREHR